MHHHPPARGRAQEDVAAERRAALAAIGAGGHVLDCALHRQAHGLDDDHLLQPEEQGGCRWRTVVPNPRAPQRSLPAARRPGARRRCPRPRPMSPSSRRHHRPRTPDKRRALHRWAWCRSAVCGAWTSWSGRESVLGWARRRSDTGRGKGGTDEIVHHVRLQIAHAPEVLQRAFALEARAAGNVDPRDARQRRNGRSEGRRRGAEQRHQRHAYGSSGMHESRVVADHDAGERQEVDRRAEVGAAGEVIEPPSGLSPDCRTDAAGSLSLGEPMSHTCMPSPCSFAPSSAK